MKKSCLILAVLMMLLQCAPPPGKEERRAEKPEATISIPCSPSGLTVRPGDRKIYLKWNTNCVEAVLLSGFNIYLLEKPLPGKYYYNPPPSEMRPYNNDPYPGDTNPERAFETMEINGLENGREYFVTVRAVFPDGSLSAASNESGVICRPEGAFTLAFRYSGKNDGFSFSAGIPVRADAGTNDIYFFQKDGFDFISSPHRLNGFLRKSDFYSLGKTSDIYKYPTLSLDIPPADKLPVLAGESYLIRTADGHYAKIRIEKADGTEKSRTLHIRYIYQTRPGLLRF